MKKTAAAFLVLLSSVFLLSCSDNENKNVVSKEKIAATGSVASSDIVRDVDPVQYSQGRRLYLANCAVCHGKQGEGAVNWRQPDADGKNPAPPLNGTGHTWHHSTNALINVIRNGTGKIGGNMPAWKDKLSNDEIKLILTWVTAQWPDELYTAWYNRFHQRSNF